MKITQDRLTTFWTQLSAARGANGPDDCWVWPVRERRGSYGASTLGRPHVAVYKLCVGDAPKGLVVAHQCRNRLCANPQHLQLATAQQNTWDRPTCDVLQALEQSELERRFKKKQQSAARRSQDKSLTLAEIKRFWSSVDKLPDGEACWLWASRIDSAGYGRFCWRDWNKGAHVVSLFLRNGKWPHLDVAHLCQTRACVNPKHLEEMTRAAHTRFDAKAGAYSNRRQKRTRTKLDDAHIRLVKERYRDEPATRDTIFAKELTGQLGVPITPSVLAAIRQGRTGSHIQVDGFVPTKKTKGNATDVERKTIMRLREDGLTQVAIAKQVGRTQSFVSKVLNGSLGTSAD